MESIVYIWDFGAMNQLRSCELGDEWGWDNRGVGCLLDGVCNEAL